jgi:hypothetical protein
MDQQNASKLGYGLRQPFLDVEHLDGVNEGDFAYAAR